MKDDLVCFEYCLCTVNARLLLTNSRYIYMEHDYIQLVWNHSHLVQFNTEDLDPNEVIDHAYINTVQ